MDLGQSDDVRDRSYCPFCGEGYGTRDDAHHAWEVHDFLKLLASEPFLGTPEVTAEARRLLGEDLQ